MDIKSDHVGYQADKQLFISSKLLLAVYIIVPVSAITLLVDTLFFNQVLKASLPYSPEANRLFTVFFVLPHLLGSAMTLLDKEYVQFYKSKLGIPLPFIAVATVLLPIVVGIRTTFLIYAVYTIYHVLTQQIGITRMLARNVDVNFWIWKWLTIGIATLAYLYIYRWNLPVEMKEILTSAGVKPVLNRVFLVLLVVLTYYAWKAAGKSGIRLGVYYLWSNYALLVTGIGALVLNYPFFTIFLFRVVHDFTAFAFYISHDYNRNLTGPKNSIYRLLKFLPIPIFVVAPLLAIAFGNIVKEIETFKYLTLVIDGLFLFHYYSEGVIWKRDTIHRRYIFVR